jgi:3-isopropylmalate/(R)-2-methylmalate dehydratase small subunit
VDTVIRGRALKYGDNINTDVIAPPQYMELSIAEAAPYAMSALDPGFAAKVRPGDILVAGLNFGSGSSRETAPLTLRHLGIGAIVATFFARIFYRNAINLGLPVIECGDSARIQDQDVIEIDLEAGLIRNLTRAETYSCSRLPQHIQALIKAGGLVPYLKQTALEPHSHL